MTERFVNLERLLGGYFHQDWDIAGATDAEVILAFRQAEPTDQVEAAASKLLYLSFIGLGDDLDHALTMRFKQNGEVKVKKTLFDPRRVAEATTETDVSDCYTPTPKFGCYDDLIRRERGKFANA